MAKVYIGMTIDILHHGHINIIQQARKYGDIVVGLLTDKAISQHKRLPFIEFEARKRIVENISGVTEVVPQNEWDYSVNLCKYKPEFMIHGDDWTEGYLKPMRDLAIKALDSYGGKLIEIPYTQGVSSSLLIKQLQEFGSSPQIRRSTLKRLLNSKSLVRVIETHSPISALIAENAIKKVNNKINQFDAFWSSSLTDSTEMGKPDIEALDISNRLTNINNIFEVTTKPLIIDADTGGKLEHFELNVRSMERLGISAVIIEDKTGLKKNSLLGNEVQQTQDDINAFSDKISAGVQSKRSDDFLIIARIESLILEKGMDDALERARAYVKAGVNGIMIHSRKKSPDEIFLFSKLFREISENIPLVCVPTSYSQVKEEELINNKFNIVIYANHLLRASYPAMRQVAESILENERCFEAEKDLISIKEILNLIPGTN